MAPGQPVCLCHKSELLTGAVFSAIRQAPVLRITVGLQHYGAALIRLTASEEILPPASPASLWPA